MPGYVARALKKFQHPTSKQPCYLPHPVKPIQYGKKIQLADPVVPSHQASKSDIKRCQQVVGTFLYYGRAVNPTFLPALNALAKTQANPSPETMKNIKQFLEFVATNPNTKIRYKASDM